VVILAILLLNGLPGFVQESRAEQAMTAPMSRVRRSGRMRELPAAELVPGDLVLLGPGDLLAADLRLTRSGRCGSTRRPSPADRAGRHLSEIDESMLADRRNMAFRGTVVTGGRGAGVLVTTGMTTELSGRAQPGRGRHP
jgi:magnesium-transporting ATPase (P-type)